MNPNQYQSLCTFAENVLARDNRWNSDGNQEKRRLAASTVTLEIAGSFHYDLKLAKSIQTDSAVTLRVKAAATFMHALRRYGSELVWADMRSSQGTQKNALTDAANDTLIAEITRTGAAFAALLPEAKRATLLAELRAHDLHSQPWEWVERRVEKSHVYDPLLALPKKAATKEELRTMIVNLQHALRQSMLSIDIKKTVVTINETSRKQRVARQTSNAGRKQKKPRRTSLRQLLVNAFCELRNASPDIGLHDAIASLVQSPYSGLRISHPRDNVREITDENSSDQRSESLNRTQLQSLFKAAK